MQEPYLVRIGAQVEVLQEAGGELAEQEVVGLVDGPQTPVGVVVGAGAGAERTHCNRKARVSGGRSFQLFIRSHCSTEYFVLD